jgi:hypothetical protein
VTIRINRAILTSDRSNRRLVACSTQTMISAQRHPRRCYRLGPPRGVLCSFSRTMSALGVRRHTVTILLHMATNLVASIAMEFELE